MQPTAMWTDSSSRPAIPACPSSPPIISDEDPYDPIGDAADAVTSWGSPDDAPHASTPPNEDGTPLSQLVHTEVLDADANPNSQTTVLDAGSENDSVPLTALLRRPNLAVRNRRFSFSQWYAL
eukprot:5130298-Amphidinium_carterae.2